MIVEVVKNKKKYKVIVPDEVPQDMWKYGIVIGPPSLESLKLPSSIEVRLHNELYNRGFITAKDLRRRMPEVTAALQAALSIDAQTIMQLYVEDAS